MAQPGSLPAWPEGRTNGTVALGLGPGHASGANARNRMRSGLSHKRRRRGSASCSARNHGWATKPATKLNLQTAEPAACPRIFSCRNYLGLHPPRIAYYATNLVYGIG